MLPERLASVRRGGGQAGRASSSGVFDRTRYAEMGDARSDLAMSGPR